ncbi:MULTISPECIES: 2-hydroxyacid dehydrogenase [Enterobacteriaceae]|uniref:2-hydroxyacid dehydrogenase n=1 Tax=Enterobacteriaceae TaxID=543 RepID=UPI000D7412DB|nr:MULTISPECIES: 2-hydroxyacid dehydrogenase [Enterobacteriaceae]MBD7493764.1 2-hydroxyacid dehydrogenase [Klebsiella pneumoniae]MDM2721811.1 2-hydroxyacid dehydrogenase [Citrobacter sp. Cy230]PXH03488.1 2-hydroxyacid dehydrogenase [Klebsiella pneumoniae]PXH52540.1 2-hydroxyacid dehydrogenase [Klebsiella variicola]VGD47676.1 D-isomer specific 2-hydroxyacid dehydrogenase family protein [Klebsiella pneumoniae]
MKTLILKLDGMPDNLEHQLKNDYELIDVYDAISPGQQDNIKSATIGVANGESQLDADFLKQFPALKLIAIFGVGFDGIDMHYARQHDITVTNTPGVLTEDVADLALTFCLALTREVIAANDFVQQGHWNYSRYPLTTKFSRRKVGIFGMGRVGQSICRRLSAFDCDIYYTDSNRVDIPATRIETVQQLAKEVDLLILSANASAQTHNIIDLAVLTALGKSGYLVNVARGSLVNQDALITALENNLIAGAALDVLAHEPEIPIALQRRSNVIITPHYASGTKETREEMKNLVCENIRLYLHSDRVLTPVK